MPTKRTTKAKPQSSRTAKKRAMTKAGFEHIEGWVPADLAKQLRKAIAAAAPGQGGARSTPTKTTPRRARATMSVDDQLSAGAVAMGMFPLGRETREERIARTG
jgi:hypothetical protein